MNSATLSGKLKFPLKTNQTSAGDTACNGVLEVQRARETIKTGVVESDLIPFAAFGKKATWMINNVSQGDCIGIVGEIHTQKYIDSKGISRTMQQINVISVEILSKSKKEEEINSWLDEITPSMTIIDCSPKASGKE